MYSAGTAFLTVVPSFKGIEKEFEAQAKRLGQIMEKSMTDAMKRVTGTSGDEGRRAGDEFGGEFEKSVKDHLDKAEKAIRKIKVDADTSELERKLAKAREELGLLRDAKIGVDLNEGELFAEIERIHREVSDLDHEHASIEIRTNAAKVLAELRAVMALKSAVDGRTASADPTAPRSQTSVGGAHVDTGAAEAKLAALDKLVDALNKRKIHIPVEVDTAGATRSIGDLNAAVAAFATTKKISVDLDVGAALADAKLLQSMLDAIGRMRVTPTVKVNVASAIGDLRTLNAKIDSAGKRSVDITANVKITGALRSIQTLETALAKINNHMTVTVDLDVGGAVADAFVLRAELNALNRTLNKLDGRTVTVTLNVNGTAAALAQLALLQAALNRLSRSSVRLGIGSGGLAAIGAAASATSAIGDAADFSLGRLGALIAIGAALGTALVPAAAAVAASISAIATAASAALAGVGVFALGIFGVVKGVAALNKAAADQQKSNKSLSSSENQVANALDGVRDAQERLTQAREDVARGSERAARAVIDAQQAVIDSERDALKAEQDLTRAKQEAQRQDEDRALSLKENALAQRQATLDITAAKADLDKILNNKRATADEREQARVTFEERLLQLDRLKTEGTRLVEDQTRVQKEGADVVVAAQERVAASQRDVAKSQQGLADAIQAQTQQQVDGQRQIRDAQQAVIRSQRQLQEAYVSSSTAGGAAMNDLKAAMDSLSPAGRRFAQFIFGLKDDFKQLQHAAEGGMLPGLQQAIEALLPFLPALRDFVGNVATALGETFVMLATTLKDPVWVAWFSYIGQTAGPTLKGMAQFTLDVATGIVGILNALTGFNAPIGQGLLKFSAMFREWATNLGTNKGFQSFLAYVRESAPKVLGFLYQAWIFVTHFVEAAAPIGTVVLGVFVKLFEWINKIPTDVLTILIATIAGVAAAFLLFAGVAALIAAPVALIIIGIAAIVAAFAILYVKVKPFRDFVDATLRAIATAAIWLWQNGIKPAVDGIVWLWQNVLAPAATALWKYVIEPTFNAIGAVVTAVWKYVLKPTFDAIAWVIQNILAPVFSWLYDHVLQPLFTAWVVLIKVLWAILEVIFGLIVIAVKAVALSFEWAWRLFLKPFWDLIVIGARAAWDFLKPFFSWLGRVWNDDIAPGLVAFGKLLGTVWDGFVSVIKVAVKFVVDTVLNDGILAGYNWLAKKFGVKPDDVRINLPASFNQSPKSSSPAQTGGRNNTHFAGGGHVRGPGGPREDKINAWLSDGEYVIPSHIVSSLGVGYFDQLIGRKTKTNDHARPGAMYADGGFVSFMKGVWDTVTDPVGWLKKQASQLLSGIPGGPWLKDTLTGIGQTAIDGVVNTVKNLLSSASTGDGGASVAGIIGDPNVVFPPWPASPSASRGDSGVWRNVVSLIKSTGPMSGTFGNAYRAGDPLWHGSGHAVDWMGFNQDGLASFLATRRPLELIHRTPQRDYAYTRGVDKGSFHEELMQEHRNHVHIAMDSGGLLPQGWSSIFNGTGRPEPVLTGQQWSTMSTLAGSQNAGPQTVNQFEFRDTTLDPAKFDAIERRQAVQARVGRAR